MKKYAALWFGIGFAVLLLLAATSPSVYVPWTAIRGTNEVLVTTNPATGRIIIGPATPISTQINAAQVWTNDGRFIYPKGTVISNSSPITIRDDGSIFTGTNAYKNNSLQIPGLWFPSVVTLTDSNEPAINYNWTSANNGNFDTYSVIAGVITSQKDSGFNQFQMDVYLTNGVEHYITLENDPSGNGLASGGTRITLQTNNVRLFSAQTTKTTNTTPLDVASLVSAYNGIATLLHRTSTNSLITVGSSPFNYTNTADQTIVLYLDANGATTTVDLNGQTIFKSLAAGDHTIILKPGAYTTVTFAIATPIMTWTEL